MATEERTGWEAIGALIGQAMDDLGVKQGDVATQLHAYLGRPIAQSKVSRNRSGRELSPELLRGYIHVLHLSPTVVGQLLGLDLGESAPATFQDFVLSDPALSDEAKQHLLTGYGLLKSASAHDRSRNAETPAHPEG